MYHTSYFHSVCLIVTDRKEQHLIKRDFVEQMKETDFPPTPHEKTV